MKKILKIAFQSFYSLKISEAPSEKNFDRRHDSETAAWRNWSDEEQEENISLK